MISLDKGGVCRPDARPSAPEVLIEREPSGYARQDCESPIEISGETIISDIAFLIIFLLFL